jgi:hypothetical protein
VTLRERPELSRAITSGERRCIAVVLLGHATKEDERAEEALRRDRAPHRRSGAHAEEGVVALVRRLSNETASIEYSRRCNILDRREPIEGGTGANE